MIPVAMISTQTLIIILVIALIVFGPQKLPEIGRQIGSAMRELKKMSGDVQRALDIDGHNGYDYYNHSSYDSTSYSYTPPVTSPEPLDQYGLDDAHPVAEIEAPAVAAKSEHDGDAKAEAKSDAVAVKPVAEKASDAKADQKSEPKSGDGAVVAEATVESPTTPASEAADAILDGATTVAEAVAPAPVATPAASGDTSA